MWALGRIAERCLHCLGCWGFAQAGTSLMIALGVLPERALGEKGRRPRLTRAKGGYLNLPNTHTCAKHCPADTTRLTGAAVYAVCRWVLRALSRSARVANQAVVLLGRTTLKSSNCPTDPASSCLAWPLCLLSLQRRRCQSTRGPIRSTDRYALPAVAQGQTDIPDTNTLDVQSRPQNRVPEGSVSQSDVTGNTPA